MRSGSLNSRELAPHQKITIEIHENAVSDGYSMSKIRSRLADYGFGFAFDDFGAGQARIAELSQVRPDYVKFDRRLICNINSSGPDRQRFVKYLVDAVNQLGVITLAEGVETAGESDACSEMGFVLGQGYHYGVPQPSGAYTTVSRQSSDLDQQVQA